MVRGVIGVNDLVRIRPGGVSVFRVLELDSDGEHAVIEAADESVPGRYPFPMRLADLIPAEQDDPGLE
ncbi:Uncharacterised protein [Nocardia farcinica]|uniref:Uncharacterized protein n=1 Tax=Nocardia farcinica TaxID=37329 RepID=A0A449HDV4_NOCFR|nr:Uncharacterised protein [Nocardia farcinica]